MSDQLTPETLFRFRAAIIQAFIAFERETVAVAEEDEYGRELPAGKVRALYHQISISLDDIQLEVNG